MAGDALAATPSVPLPREPDPPRPEAGRLRALLAATRALSAELTLSELLQQIVQSACDLVEARYGALTVRDATGGVGEFVHVGVPDAVAAQIENPPTGAGLLGLLAHSTEPLRIEDVAAHPAAAGFPPGHPTMRSFLGIPLCLGGDPCGCLCVAERLDGEPFTAEDEELLVALAGAAALAIANARLDVESRRRQRWLEASATITTELLTGDADPLPLIAGFAREVAGADLASIVLPVPNDAELLAVVTASGVGADLCRGLSIPRDGSLVGRALDEGVDINLRDTGGQTFVKTGVPLGPALVVRLRAPSGATGALTLTREHGARPFSPEELTMAGAFAAQASLALQLREGQRINRQLEVLHERERIGEQLHDNVVRDLFGTVLALQSLAARTQTVRDELVEQVLRVEETIRSIRRSVYNTAQRGTGDWRRNLVDVASQVTMPSGAEPEIVLLQAPAELPAPATQQVLTGVQRVLSAVAALPGADASSVTVAGAADRLVVEVAADAPAVSDELATVARALPGGVLDLRDGHVSVRWSVAAPATAR